MKYYCAECGKREMTAAAVIAAVTLELQPICERCARSAENQAAGLPLEKHIDRIVSMLGRERLEYAQALGFESFGEMVKAKRAAFDRIAPVVRPVFESVESYLERAVGCPGKNGVTTYYASCFNAPACGCCD